MALADDDMAVVLHRIVNFALSRQGRYDGDIDLACRFGPPAANRSNGIIAHA